MFAFLYFVVTCFLFLGSFPEEGLDSLILQLRRDTYFNIICIKCTVCLQQSFECLSFPNLRNKYLPMQCHAFLFCTIKVKRRSCLI